MTTYNATSFKAAKFNQPKLNLVSGLYKKIKSTLERRKALTQLSDLPDYLLQDIGITRADISKNSGEKLWVK